MTPLVSICCVTYNHEKYIADAIESFLMQKTDFPFEIIIHDDASTDNTAKIIREYEERYPKIIKAIYQKENQYSKGVSIQSFYLKYLQGKYIAICEGDDYWTDPYKLAKQVNFLESNPNYIATAHNVRTINEHGEEVEDSINPYKIYPSHIFTIKDAEQLKLPGQTASIVYRNIWPNTRNDIIEQYRSCRINGDIKLAIFLALQGDIYCFNDVMADHRKIISHGDSWSARTYRKNLSLYRYHGILDINRFVKLYYNTVLNNQNKRFDAIYRALIEAIFHPTLDNFRILKEVIRISKGERIKCILYAPVKLLEKLKQNMSIIYRKLNRTMQ